MTCTYCSKDSAWINNSLPPTPDSHALASHTSIDDSQRLQFTEGLNTTLEALSEVEALIKELEGRRCEINARVDLFRCALAPIRLLPLEILGEIFLKGFIELDGRDSPLSGIYVWSISQVCATWRATALAQPRLWSVLHCDDSRAVHRFSKEREAWALKHARDNLDVRLVHTPCPPHILKSAPRITSLSCHSADPTDSIVAACTNLVHLTLSTDTHTIINHSPHLRSFTLVVPRWSQMDMLLPWSQIIHFKCDIWPESPLNITKYLSEMVNLESLTVEHCGETLTDPPPNPDSIHLLNLRSLTILGEYHPPWLEQLSMPMLTELSLDYISNQVIDRVITLRLKSGFQLLRFTVDLRRQWQKLVIGSNAKLATLFQAMPTLTHLNVAVKRNNPRGSHERFAGSLINVLFADIKEHCVIPALEVLEWEHFGAVIPSRFIEMIHTRYHKDRRNPLRVVAFPRKFTNNDLDNCKSIVDLCGRNGLVFWNGPNFLAMDNLYRSPESLLDDEPEETSSEESSGDSESDSYIY